MVGVSSSRLSCSKIQRIVQIWDVYRLKFIFRTFHKFIKLKFITFHNSIKFEFFMSYTSIKFVFHICYKSNDLSFEEVQLFEPLNIFLANFRLIFLLAINFKIKIFTINTEIFAWTGTGKDNMIRKTRKQQPMTVL